MAMIEATDLTPGWSIGFGCASLYALPSKRDRQLVLEAAYDAGIRHFDVAPIYGLGAAERELGKFTVTRPDVHVATKFGLRPNMIGRSMSMVQSPVRRVLKARPHLNSRMRGGAQRPSRTYSDRILYTAGDYSVGNARRALAESLRNLGVDRVEYFFLHEPGVSLPGGDHDLLDFLEGERQKGSITHWGVAGDQSLRPVDGTALGRSATAQQIPYDLISGYQGPAPVSGRSTITYGFISQSLPRLRQLIAADQKLRRTCSELVDADLREKDTAIRLLVRDALRHNHNGTVLVSSTNVRHLAVICAAAKAPLPNEDKVANLIRLELNQTPPL